MGKQTVSSKKNEWVQNVLRLLENKLYLNDTESFYLIEGIKFLQGRKLSDVAERLVSIEQKRNISFAKQYLGSLRGRDTIEGYHGHAQSVRRFIAQAGIAPEDIGTSEEELERLGKPPSILFPPPLF